MKLWKKPDEMEYDVTITITGKHGDFKFFSLITHIIEEALRKEDLFNGMVWGDYSDKKLITDTIKVNKPVEVSQ